MQHHSIFPRRPDPEGDAARMTVFGAAVVGPICLMRLWLWAWKRAKNYPADRAWMLAELMLKPACYTTGIALAPERPELLLFTIMVHMGAWVFPMLTVYLPHNNYGGDPLTQTGTMRGFLLPHLFFETTFHLEHHLYPKVPAHKLRALSERIDPLLRAGGVKPVRVP
jgi:beta-carotene hydroxylase